MEQVLAIVELRFRLLANSLRRKGSLTSIFSGTVVMLFGILLSLALATGVALLANAGVDQQRPDLLQFAYIGAFWAAIVFGIFMPLALSSGSTGMDMSKLLVFPVSRQRLFAISLGSAFLSPDHLFYYPTLLVTCFVGVLLPGEPALLGISFFLLSTLVVVFWARTLMAILQGVVSSRRSKEWVGMIGFGVLVLGGLLPAMFSGYAEKMGEEGEQQLMVVAQVFVAIAGATPPNLAADGLTAMHARDTDAALHALAWLAVWAVAGLASAYLAFTRIALSSSSGSGGARLVKGETPKRGRDVTELFPFLPSEVLAVASKELRYLLRSSVGKFNLVMIPIFAALVAFVIAPHLEHPLFGVGAEELSLYGMLLYVVLFSNNMVNNSLSWEGAGCQMYLISPVPFERIVLGKNLGLWTYNAMMFAIVLLAWIVLVGSPGLAALITGALLFAGSMVIFATLGNFISISFPVSRSISSMKSTPSQPAVFLSMLILLGLALANAFFLGMPSLLGVAEARPLSLLVYFLLGVGAYRLSLRPVARHFAERREAVLAALEGTVE